MKSLTARFPAALTFLFASLLMGCGQKTEVLARVGSSKISLADFEREMGALPAQSSYAQTLPGKKEFLELMVRRKIVLSEAERAGLLEDPAVGKELLEIEKEFQKQREAARERVLVSAYLKSLKERDLKVTEEEIKKTWEQGEEVRASHILFSSSAATQAVLSRLQKGESFEDLAKKYSEDPATAGQGGDLGFFCRGTLIPEFENVVFSLKVGEVSGVISSPFGYHIIRKTGVRPLSRTPYEKARIAVRTGLEKQRFQAWIDKTRGRYAVSLNLPALEKFQAAR